MLSFPASLVRTTWLAAALFSAVAFGQASWLLSPVGFGPGQQAMSGAALLSNKGVAALASNPAEVASLRGLAFYASGDFALTSLQRQGAEAKRHVLARPQLAAAWRLPEGFAAGLGWGRGSLWVEDVAKTQQVPLHRMLANVAWEWLPGWRLGAAVQLATTESAAWRWGEESWRGGRIAAATRAGLTADVMPKRFALALQWEEGLSLSSRKGGFPRLKTPHSLALALWLGQSASWEFEADFVYGWQRTQADAAGNAQVREDTLGVRAGMGLWLTPVIQLRAGGAVFSHKVPSRPSWLQPMDAWSGSLSAGALWRYGPLRLEMAWQLLAGFESAKAPASRLKQRVSNLLSLGVGWSFD